MLVGGVGAGAEAAVKVYEPLLTASRIFWLSLAYVLANYKMNILGSILALAILVFVVWKFALPRVMSGKEAAAVPVTAGGPDAAATSAVGAGIITPAKPASDWEGFAPDPAVVAPNGTADTSSVTEDNVLASEQEAAAFTQAPAAEPLNSVPPAGPLAPMPPTLVVPPADASAVPAMPAPDPQTTPPAVPGEAVTAPAPDAMPQPAPRSIAVNETSGPAVTIAPGTSPARPDTSPPGRTAGRFRPAALLRC